MSNQILIQTKNSIIKLNNKVLMKKLITLLSTGILAILITACGTTREVTQSEKLVKENLLINNTEKEIVLPCVDNSYDDKENFRALGIGYGASQSKSRSIAFEDAQAMLRKRLNGLVTKVASDYLEYIDAKSDNSGTEKTLSSIASSAVKKVINDAMKTCERNTIDKLGRYHAYIAIEVPKKDITKEIENMISNNEELRVKFNREQFRKFADQKFNELDEYKHK